MMDGCLKSVVAAGIININSTGVLCAAQVYSVLHRCTLCCWGLTLVTWLTALAARAALAMSSSLLLEMAEMKFR